MKASTSIDWHLERWILNNRDPEDPNLFRDNFKEKVRNRMEAEHSLFFMLTSREPNEWLCTNVVNYDFYIPE